MSVAGVEEQLTIRELLKDPVYKKWLLKNPTHLLQTSSPQPWRLWVQRQTGGSWAKRDFAKYSEAMIALKQQLARGVHDANVSSRVTEFRPPVVKQGGKRRYHIPAFPGQNANHRWCSLCRRPTIFTYFRKHHALPRAVINYKRRCAICGIAEEWMRVKP